MFHAFTGCDTVSSFAGKGKKSFFEALKAYPKTNQGLIAAASGDMDVPILKLSWLLLTTGKKEP